MIPLIFTLHFKTNSVWRREAYMPVYFTNIFNPRYNLSSLYSKYFPLVEWERGKIPLRSPSRWSQKALCTMRIAQVRLHPPASHSLRTRFVRLQRHHSSEGLIRKLQEYGLVFRIAPVESRALKPCNSPHLQNGYVKSCFIFLLYSVVTHLTPAKRQLIATHELT